MKVTVKAHAKLNLTLDIIGKRDDDYHLLESVMQSVSLHDLVTVRKVGGSEITVSTSDESIADDQSNIAYRAAEAFFEATGIPRTGIEIKIKKNIPTGAGMAGGSADGAAVIIAMNEIFETGLDTERMCDIGGEVGADIPFCISGGTMMARGTGSILAPLPDMPDCWFVIAKPECSVSTAEAYRAVDRHGDNFAHPDSETMCEDICSQDIAAIACGLCNVFEQVLDLPDVASIRQVMLDAGALGACMTGSGSAVFGIFTDKDAADDCVSLLERSYDDVFSAQPVSCGCETDL